MTHLNSVSALAVVFLGLFLVVGVPLAATPIAFPSGDGLEVSAELSMPHPAGAPLVILCHMAGSSRGEYRSIAPRLNELGFNTLALDQRSGGSSGGIANETARRAWDKRLGTAYADALQDMAAALDFVRGRYATGKIILWGSSYSASLALKLAGDFPASCDAVLAFSPGEYFSKPNYVASSAVGIVVPVFVTSMRHEEESWRAIFDAIPSKSKVAFVPGAYGVHGSPCLEAGASGEAEYWTAVKAFLAGLL